MAETPALVARDLSVSLGGVPILKSVDLQVRRGDLYGLLGRNGAGKTTAMRCMLGFLPDYGGTCEVFGTAARHLHACERPIGTALDPPGLDDTLTVRQNLELARIRSGLTSGRSVDDVLDLVQLGHRQHNRGDRLSHGQGRRAAVARALLGEPEVLVLDEPLSGLDPEGVEQLLELFVRVTRDEGVTVLLSSHHLREVQHVCNRVGLIEDGKVLLEEDTQELLARAGERVEIECSDEEGVRKALDSNDSARDIETVRPGRVAARIDGGADLAALLAALVAAGLPVTEFRRERATLVDVFREAIS